VDAHSYGKRFVVRADEISKVTLLQGNYKSVKSMLKHASCYDRLAGTPPHSKYFSFCSMG